MPDLSFNLWDDDEPAKTEPVKSVKKKKPKKQKTASSNGSTIRGVPPFLISMMRKEFPSAKNMADLLVAYVVCHTPGCDADVLVSDLTQDQKDLIASWNGTVFDSLDKKVSRLYAKMEKVQDGLSVNQMLMAYLLFDRLGYRQELSAAPESVNFNEDGVLSLLMHAEEVSPSMMREKARIQGRPIGGV